jgi:hypothetical protein
MYCSFINVHLNIIIERTLKYSFHNSSQQE